MTILLRILTCVSMLIWFPLETFAFDFLGSGSRNYSCTVRGATTPWLFDARDFATERILWDDPKIPIVERATALKVLSELMQFTKESAPELDKDISIKCKGSFAVFAEELKKASKGDFEIVLENVGDIVIDLEASATHGVDVLFSVMASSGLVCEFAEGKLVVEPYQGPKVDSILNFPNRKQ